MNYDFTLDKKGIVSVLASWVVMGLLLFVAGLIVGTYWTSNGSSASAAASAKAAGVAGKDVATLPQEPVLRTGILPRLVSATESCSRYFRGDCRR